MSSAEVTVLPGNGGNPFSRVLYMFKEKSFNNIYRLFPDPESSLLAGILLGVDTGLTCELQQAFKNTGTAHIIAISGFNISIIAGMFLTFFSRFLGQKRGAVVAMLGISLIYFHRRRGCGGRARRPHGRFGIFAKQLGRRQTALNTLLRLRYSWLLSIRLCIWDVGFQLSFFATLGLILYAEPFSQVANDLITRYFPTSTAEKFAELFSEFVLLTLAAQLTTIPIMAYHFQRISLVSFIANPVHSACTAGGDDHRWPGGFAESCLVSAWSGCSMDGMALCRLHDPHGGIIRPCAEWDHLFWEISPSGS